VGELAAIPKRPILNMAYKKRLIKSHPTFTSQMVALIFSIIVIYQFINLVSRTFILTPNEYRLDTSGE